MNHRIDPHVTDLRIELPSNNDQSTVLRERLRAWCALHNCSRDLSDDVQLVASELFSNAVRATTDGSPVAMVVTLRGEWLDLEMINQGPRFDPDSLPVALPDGRGGRGIAIARAVGEMTVTHNGGLTTVRVTIG